MSNISLLSALSLSVGLVGCATLASAPPADLKPVEVGSVSNEAFDRDNTILYFPAGKPLPLRVVAKGSIFKKTIDQVETFVLKRDVYVWRSRVSFDGKHWLDSDDAFDGKMAFEFTPADVRFSVSFDETGHE